MSQPKAQIWKLGYCTRPEAWVRLCRRPCEARVRYGFYKTHGEAIESLDDHNRKHHAS